MEKDRCISSHAGQGRCYWLALSCMVLVAAALWPPAAARAAELDAFDDGETFTYQVSWAVFSNAGQIVVAAEKVEAGGENILRITVDTETSGLVGSFYPLQTRNVALIDAETGRILRNRETGFDGRRGVDRETTFDYEERRAVFMDRVRPERNRIIDFPEGEAPTDLILGLIQTRRWNMQLGEEREMAVYASRDIYPLAIRAEDYREVSTPMGDFQALLLVAAMRGEPKGIFESGDFGVWIAEGSEPLPVMMQVSLDFGVVTLRLIDHDSGRSAGEG